MLAVSGGLDSVALLHLFLDCCSARQYKLGVVHVNHCLRAQESDDDESFVEKLASTKGLPFFSARRDVKKLARTAKLSLEEAARVARYEFFEKVLNEQQADALATGHTANDQAETVLDHFLRGSGSAGLAGMRRVRGRIIRPLLEFTRQELAQYLTDIKCPFREDASNSDLAFRRNRIRKELLPYLSENFNPGLTESLVRTSGIFHEIEEFLLQEGGKALKLLVSLQEKDQIVLDIDRYMTYNCLVQKYVLYQCCLELSLERNHLNFEGLHRILNLIRKRAVGTRTNVTNDFEVLIDHDGIVFRRKALEQLPRIELDLLGQRPLKFHTYQFDWSIRHDGQSSMFTLDPGVELFDLDKIGAGLSLRAFRSGDCFMPLNFQGRKKVADYFADAKVPLRQRDFVPILESEKGILWVCGYRMDDRFKVTESTRKILRIEMKERAHAN